ncbi:hypothetical protein ACM39_04070 [Chryseobacterium sp. FH2]|uniref:hypothetical protein n=1 Tax=Chryseobacterium sp. FH2 TaxID=1674291 RepID=UPI00065AFEA2|nr:hypothetical protein [Chryseobacterium sp. FH2]KMQ69463.1 hypothetical protein ACM39_04070 [Chryseobacterium sp. FH2]
MKQFYNLKSLLRLSFLFVVLLSITSAVQSCKKDDDDDDAQHLVQFESKIITNGPTPAPTPPVIGSFNAIATQVGTAAETNYTAMGIAWKSDEFFVNESQAQLRVAASANLPYTDSKLIVTMWIDGEIAESDTVVGKGTNIVASVTHSFLEL